MIRVALICLALCTPLTAEPVKLAELMPFPKIVMIVKERFHGRLLGARLDSPKAFEFASGVHAVHELTLLSPQNNVIRIRLDAETGRILDVRGRGLTAARHHDEGDHE
ncbi:PepSY domain-containing protein [Paracoccus aerodenitrificans]|uniref:PepSY domain-containing protein n=1 Tax=Paracoccus aerodenitrificans TaxID=3017781 RepID=UPI0022EFE31D|nr:hypothetical protein [Paracoccus aerodenitrificans]WBU65230.1 hypothetical protein PAE61_07335 [Paracoccus aerodenitrificans]